MDAAAEPTDTAAGPVADTEETDAVVDTTDPADTSTPSEDGAPEPADVEATDPPDSAGDAPTPEPDTSVDPPVPGDMDGDRTPDDEDPDIDGDGYPNDHETDAGTDPMDPDSVIYQGGWPYNPDKEAIADPGWGSEPLLGTVMPNYQAQDQHGDLVSLYDFAHQGKPVVLDVVTWFCEPCKAMADYFANGDPSVMDEFLFFQDKYDVIRDLIVNEDIYWITIIWSGGAPVEQADAALWEETWPNEHIVVLADVDLTLQSYLYVKAMPRIDVLDEDMSFVAFCDGDVPCDSELEGGGPGGPIAGLKWLESYYQSLGGQSP